MSCKATSDEFYTPLQRRLHWLVIVLLAGQYLLQGPMHDALAAIERQESLGFWQFLVTTVHTWGGIVIAVIMLWRWQLRRTAVPLNGGQLAHSLERLVRIHHVMLYIAIGVMTGSGGLHYYLGWQVAGRWHELGKWVLCILILVHVAGALSHAASDNIVLRRMMGRNSLR